MIGLENTTNAIGNVMRRSYDQYATAAQFRNAVFREQLQAMQDFVSISDKLLSLPFPGLMAADRNSDTYKELAVEMQNAFTEHSRGTLELWASMFRYEVAGPEEPLALQAPEEEKAAAPSADRKPKTNGKKPAAEAAPA
jgi:hypothetical protein